MLSIICGVDASTVTDQDRQYLRQCVDLARQALEAGDEPFGSVLVDSGGTVVHRDRNRISTGDATAHPELALVRWAIEHLSTGVRARTTVYTSGEHCPMCSAAHAWAGMGRIVYASSSAQLAQWLTGWDLPEPPVRGLPITTVAPNIPVAGPDEELAGQVRGLHLRYHGLS